jgi:outer membrane protein OmpA-like peptidoglycan-associated protein
MTVRVSERVLLTREGKRPCGYFATGGRVLDNCAKAALDDLAVRMKNDARLQAKIIGYTDGSRYETSLKNLGERRAKAVSAYLEKKGVDPSRLVVVDEGANNPVGDNKTAAGRKLNRRVEIELTAR